MSQIVTVPMVPTVISNSVAADLSLSVGATVNPANLIAPNVGIFVSPGNCKVAEILTEGCFFAPDGDSQLSVDVMQERITDRVLDTETFGSALIFGYMVSFCQVRIHYG
jgi:hypothetical protein